MSGAELHPLVAGFADAATYDRGRPRYGEEVVRNLIAQLGLRPGAPVLELGPGTGQLSTGLLAAGLDVIAVEPLASMRGLLAEAIGQARVRAGVAEEIPLAEDTVDAVLAADSFHWFDEARALPEIRRVLRPRGGVAILRSVPVLDGPWSAELGEIMTVTRPEHPAFGERGAAAALEEDAAFGPVSELVVNGEQELDRAAILAYLGSVSWIATLPAQERAELLSRARAVLERHDVTRVRHPVRHEVWTARLR